MEISTIKIISGDSFALLNEDDFNASIHSIYIDKNINLVSTDELSQLGYSKLQIKSILDSRPYEDIEKARSATKLPLEGFYV